MADWEIAMRVTVLGVGNTIPQQKLVRRVVQAPSLEGAIGIAKTGLLTVQVLGGKALDPADATILDEPVNG